MQIVSYTTFQSINWSKEFYIIIINLSSFFLHRISHYEQRLNTLFYKKKFAQSISEMEPKIVAVLGGSKEVARSKKLKKLLEIILALGNYMNRGQRGNAVGFRISSLNRLSDTKSSTKNTTLLHYLVHTLELKVFYNSNNSIENKTKYLLHDFSLKMCSSLKQASKVRYHHS